VTASTDPAEAAAQRANSVGATKLDAARQALKPVREKASELEELFAHDQTTFADGARAALKEPAPLIGSGTEASDGQR